MAFVPGRAQRERDCSQTRFELENAARRVGKQSIS